MNTIYIVIVAKLLEDNKLLYLDETEKYLTDYQNVLEYSSYLNSKYDHSHIVVKSDIKVETSIDINNLLAMDALNKLTQSELDALKQIITNE